jgi:hypothetical protein
VIFDATNMNDYHPMARTFWQKTISQHKSKINLIWVISDSFIVLASAKIMGLFTSVKIKAAKPEEYFK